MGPDVRRVNDDLVLQDRRKRPAPLGGFVFGDDEVLYGVSLEEFEQINSMLYRGIAEYHGLVAEERREGDDVVVTFRRLPEP
jgi:hypothetical protein